MKSLISSLALGFLVLYSALFSTAAVAQDASLGRWCDRMLPGMPDSHRILEIVHREEGAIELRYVFMDGTNDFTGLEQEGENLYSLMGSPFGDQMRINEEGDLEMFDDDGPIRVAERLTNSPRPRECS